MAVSWVITEHCNLRCEYCACPLIANKELSAARCMALLDEMAEMGTRRIKFTGGEPLVRKDLAALIARAVELGIGVSLNTNGTLVPRMIDALAGVSSVSISLDGAAEVHDRHRGEGQTGEVLAAARALRSVGIPIRLQGLLTARSTRASVDYVLDVAEQYGATAAFQPALDIMLGTTDPNPVAVEVRHVRRLLAYVDGCRRAGRPVGQSSAALGDLGRFPAVRRLRCIGGRVACRLDPRGNLTACHERPGTVPHVSAAELGFKEAFRRLRPEPCTECWGAGRAELHAAARLAPSALLGLLGLPAGPRR